MIRLFVLKSLYVIMVGLLFSCSNMEGWQPHFVLPVFNDFRITLNNMLPSGKQVVDYALIYFSDLKTTQLENDVLARAISQLDSTQLALLPLPLQEDIAMFMKSISENGLDTELSAQDLFPNVLQSISESFHSQDVAIFAISIIDALPIEYRQTLVSEINMLDPIIFQDSVFFSPKDVLFHTQAFKTFELDGLLSNSLPVGVNVNLLFRDSLHTSTYESLHIIRASDDFITPQDIPISMVFSASQIDRVRETNYLVFNINTKVLIPNVRELGPILRSYVALTLRLNSQINGGYIN